MSRMAHAATALVSPQQQLQLATRAPLQRSHRSVASMSRSQWRRTLSRIVDHSVAHCRGLAQPRHVESSFPGLMCSIQPCSHGTVERLCELASDGATHGLVPHPTTLGEVDEQCRREKIWVRAVQGTGLQVFLDAPACAETVIPLEDRRKVICTLVPDLVATWCPEEARALRRLKSQLEDSGCKLRNTQVIGKIAVPFQGTAARSSFDALLAQCDGVFLKRHPEIASEDAREGNQADRVTLEEMISACKEAEKLAIVGTQAQEDWFESGRMGDRGVEYWEERRLEGDDYHAWRAARAGADVVVVLGELGSMRPPNKTELGLIKKVCEGCAGTYRDMQKGMYWNTLGNPCRSGLL